MEKTTLLPNAGNIIGWLVLATLSIFCLSHVHYQQNTDLIENNIKDESNKKNSPQQTLCQDIPKAPATPKAQKNTLFHSEIEQAADLHQVDSALIRAIIMAESGFNPNAVSHKGAMGLMQLMPKTAASLGVENGFDPKHNINAGVRYFKRLLNRFDGNLEYALAAYNAGSRKVRQYQGIPPFKATQHYIKKVLKYYEYYKTEDKSNIERT